MNVRKTNTNGDANNDAVTLLEIQHREIEELFSQLAGAEEADRKAAIFRTIADGLAIHAALGEHHFYPAIRERRTRDALLATLDDHLAIKRMLADILDIAVTDPIFDIKLKTLREQTQRHMREEERDLFPGVRRLFTAEELVLLARQMSDEQRTLEGTEPSLRLPWQVGVRGAGVSATSTPPMR